jgi:hypothetical protein
MKPTVGFKLPWAGVTPAPGILRTMRDGVYPEHSIGSFLELGGEASETYLARHFTGEEAGRIAAGR